MPFDRNELKDMQAAYKLIRENHDPTAHGLAGLSEDELYETLDLLHARIKHDQVLARKRLGTTPSEDGEEYTPTEEEFNEYLSSIEPSPTHPHVKLACTLGELEGLNFAHYPSRSDLEKYRDNILEGAFDVLWLRHYDQFKQMKDDDFEPSGRYEHLNYPPL